MIYANARRTSIANDDLLQIQHLKSSRAAKMGVGKIYFGVDKVLMTKDKKLIKLFLKLS